MFLHFILLSLIVMLTACSPASRWSQLDHQTARHFQAGEYAPAIASAKQALEFSEAAFGSNHQSVTTSLSNLIFLHSLQGNYEAARSLLYRALAVKKLEVGSEHMATGRLLTRLSEIYRFEGKYNEAEFYGHRALKILEQDLPAHHYLLAEAVNNLALVYYVLNKNIPAAAFFKKTVGLRDNLSGISNSALPPYSRELENLMRRKEPSLKTAAGQNTLLALRYNKSGPARYDYAPSLINLSLLYSSQGHFNRAESLARQALETDQAHLGDQHPCIAADLDCLAQIHISRARWAEADLLYGQALDILKKNPDAGYLPRIRIMQNYADLLNKLARPVEAEELEMEIQAVGAQNSDIP
jgi:tetratricopeptide (TPR) repeat protein